MTQEALKLALEALEANYLLVNGTETHYGLEQCLDGYYSSCFDTDPINKQTEEAITAIKEALAQPEQEPVAYLVLFEGAGQLLEFKKGNYLHGAKVKHIPLYTKTQIEIGCSECGIGGGHALYCVRCAEKFVGGYKESVPVHASELLTQVSTDTPPQRTWVDVPDEEIKILWIQYRAALPRYLCFAKALLARAKEENT